MGTKQFKPEEHAVCKRRGHDPEGRTEKWEQCRHCGIWTRVIKQEHENPPEEERHAEWHLQKRLREMGQGGAE